MQTIQTKTLQLLSKLNWLPPLLARLTTGIVFAESGWGKLQNLERVTSYFTSLGIPFAEIQAPFVAGLELVGGLLLIFGLFTRVWALLLSGVMGVALVTAKLQDVSTPTDILGFVEFLYLILLIDLFVRGPGRIALDALFKKTSITS